MRFNPTLRGRFQIKKRARLGSFSFPFYPALCLSEAQYIPCLQTPVAFYKIKLHPFPRFQSPVSVTRNEGVVNKNVVPVRSGDETVALPGIEPFDYAFYCCCIQQNNGILA